MKILLRCLHISLPGGPMFGLGTLCSIAKSAISSPIVKHLTIGAASYAMDKLFNSSSSSSSGGGGGSSCCSSSPSRSSEPEKKVEPPKSIGIPYTPKDYMYSLLESNNDMLEAGFNRSEALLHAIEATNDYYALMDKGIRPAPKVVISIDKD